ncbi:MAG: FdrA, partial [Candidatus Cloacimonetes bacterium]|nr:FdrA [Candidatus Cloacimonadota bacterium]
MIAKATIVQGLYLDSVKLMLISKDLRNMKGVVDAVAIMATKENREILAATNMLVDAIMEAKESEIVIVVKAESETCAKDALSKADELLRAAPAKHEDKGKTAHNISTAIKNMEISNLCLISVAGRYATAEADNALEAGLHVMLFSDNVSLEE